MRRENPKFSQTSPGSFSRATRLRLEDKRKTNSVLVITSLGSVAACVTHHHVSNEIIRAAHLMFVLMPQYLCGHLLYEHTLNPGKWGGAVQSCFCLVTHGKPESTVAKPHTWSTVCSESVTAPTDVAFPEHADYSLTVVLFPSILWCISVHFNVRVRMKSNAVLREISQQNSCRFQW